MRLLFCGSGWLPMMDFIRSRLPADATLSHWDRSAPLASVVGEIDVLLPSNARITPDVVMAAHRLRLIQQPAAGVEYIDRTVAEARGIPICNAPGANYISVAETTLYLLLALTRRAPALARAFAQRELGAPLGSELAGRTLGVIGMGKTGTAVAERARAFGMTILALGRSATDSERIAFFSACDAITIHCPLTPETRGLINSAAFAAMRPGVLLVNAARGDVIDRAALIAALADNKLGGVGLDVHWVEPADPADPLYADLRVVALPHVGGSSTEAFARIAGVVIENLGRLTRGEPLLHRVV